MLLKRQLKNVVIYRLGDKYLPIWVFQRHYRENVFSQFKFNMFGCILDFNLIWLWILIWRLSCEMKEQKPVKGNPMYISECFSVTVVRRNLHHTSRRPSDWWICVNQSNPSFYRPVIPTSQYWYENTLGVTCCQHVYNNTHACSQMDAYTACAWEETQN